MYSFKLNKAYVIFILFFILLACNKEISPPEADFQVSQVTTMIGNSINFFDKSKNNPTSWLWDFGDGETSTDQNPTHTYKSIAKYTISLTVENEAGTDKKIWEDFINVTNGPIPEVEFEADIEITDIETPVNFTDLSTNNPSAWVWDFGDGTLSNEQNPSHIYEEIGKYSVRLKAINEYGKDSIIKRVYIDVFGKLLYDIDNNMYTSNKVGNRYWMRENLKVTSYPDGSAIPNVQDNSEWAELNDIDAAYCSNEGNGTLYTWSAAVNNTSENPLMSDPVQGVCPDGWHVPNLNEWFDLIEKDTVGLISFPSNGYRDYNSGGILSSSTYWWSSTIIDSSDHVNAAETWNGIDNLWVTSRAKSNGFSVRCVKAVEE